MRLVVTAQKKWEALTLSLSLSLSLNSLRDFLGAFLNALILNALILNVRESSTGSD